MTDTDLQQQSQIDAALDAALDELGDDENDEMEMDSNCNEDELITSSVAHNAQHERHNGNTYYNADKNTSQGASPSSSRESDASTRETSAKAIDPVSATTDPTQQKQGKVPMGPPRPPSQQPSMGAGTDDLLERMMQQMLSSTVGGDDLSSDDAMLGQFLEQMKSQIQSDLQQLEKEEREEEEGKKQKQAKSKPSNKVSAADKSVKAPSSSPEPSQVRQKESSASGTTPESSTQPKKHHQAIAALVEEMSKTMNEDKNSNGIHPNQQQQGLPENDDNAAMLLQDLMQSIQQVTEQLSSDLDETSQRQQQTNKNSNSNSGNTSSSATLDALMDGMMEQLLSKELMYEPIKQVTTQFPTWLEQQKEALSEEEYQSRQGQYKAFQQLLLIYETDPNNIKSLQEQMSKVQEFGQPPLDLIQQILPGFDDRNGAGESPLDPDQCCIQ